MLDRDRGERAPVAGEEDVIDVASDRPRPAVGEVVRQPGLGHGAQGHEPLLAALAPDPEVAVGEQITNTQTGQLGQPQPGVEEERDDQPIAARGDRQESLELDRSERRDEPGWHPRAGQPAERILGDETLGGAPGRERAETADEARDRRWREPGLLERDDERPRLGDAHRAERRIGAAARPEGGEPLADHRVPVERLGRQAPRSARHEEVGQAIGEGERRA